MLYFQLRVIVLSKGIVMKATESDEIKEPNEKLALHHHFSQGFADSATKTKAISTYLFIGCALGLFLSPAPAAVSGTAAMMVMAVSYLAESSGKVSSLKTKDYANDTPPAKAKEFYEKGSSVFIAAALTTALLTQGMLISALFNDMVSSDQPAVTAPAIDTPANSGRRATDHQANDNNPDVDAAQKKQQTAPLPQAPAKKFTM